MQRLKLKVLTASVTAVLALLAVAVSSAAASPLVYHGGSVVRNPQVRVVFWGSNWNQYPGAREQIQGLFSTLSGSNYQGILTQYYDTGGTISPNVSFSSWTDQSIAAPNNVNWLHIEEEAQYAVKQQGWPAGGINNLYMVLPAPGSKYQSGFVLGCGSHYFSSALGSPDAYVGWPGDEPFKGCLGNGGTPSAGATVTASHEYAEAVTDPVTKKYAGTFTGWITEEKEDEIADKCYGLGGGAINGIYMSYLWDNSIEACTLSHPPVPSTRSIAFQSNTGQLVSMGWGGNWSQGMMPGTSPSVAALSTGGYEIAFQSNLGQLITVGAAGGTNWGQGMKAGTSPAITALPNGGYEMAFQANTGQLYSIGTASGSTNWGQGMAPGTSPDITAVPGGYEMTFQANTGQLYSIGTAGGQNWGQGMAPGTSPAITTLSNGAYLMAFQSNVSQLVSIGPGNGINWGQGMKASTSPDITALPNGGYEMAFQANTGQLYSIGTAGGQSWNQGMAPSTSPSIATTPNGSYEMAFQSNVGQLVSIGPGTGSPWYQGMATGTSPSIAFK